MKKFDQKKHILDYYIVNNQAVIKVLIDRKEDFYNPYDPREMRINREIIDYINEEAMNIPFKYKVAIEFSTPRLTEEEKRKITKMVHNYYGLMISRKDSMIRMESIKALCLLLLGALIISCSLLGKNVFSTVYIEIIYIIGWVLLWEATEILLLSSNHEKVEKKNYQQLYQAEILFADKLEIKNES